MAGIANRLMFNKSSMKEFIDPKEQHPNIDVKASYSSS